MGLQDLWRALVAQLRGHYHYYGVSGHWRMITKFDDVTMRMLCKWLNRRSGCKSFTWRQVKAYLAHYPLPRPRVVHRWYRPSSSPETG